VFQMNNDGQQGRKTFYYGWANLAIAALAMVGTLP